MRVVAEFALIWGAVLCGFLSVGPKFSVHGWIAAIALEGLLALAIQSSTPIVPLPGSARREQPDA
jgi:hypothetical protein